MTQINQHRLTELCQSVVAVDEELRSAASMRMKNLTKPVGSLGALEHIAVQVAAIQKTDRPELGKKRIIVCAGDHGVVAEGVAAYPQEVTKTMAMVIGAGLAAVCQLAAASDVEIDAYNIGIAGGEEEIAGVTSVRVQAGTANMAVGPAMSPEVAAEAMLAGADAASRAIAGGVTILGIGEMGIGNSTAAAALTAAFTGAPIADCVGAGAGSDSDQMARKADAIERAFLVNGAVELDALGKLSALGGLEIAMMAGVVIGAAAGGVPVVSDGYIAGSAVMAALAMCPAASGYVIYSHRSAEPGHRYMYEHLNARPLLELDLRLGEGTGAALAMPLIDGACRVLSNMLTFEEAGISV